MLKREVIIYNDGRKEDKIIYVGEGVEHKYDPQRDNIRHIYSATFKYKVRLKPGEAVALLKTKDDVTLYPSMVKVHPQTTMDDIEVIKTRPKKKKQESTLHNFESASSGSIYTVREVAGKYKCNCPGYYRSKERKCKHIKELEGK